MATTEDLELEIASDSDTSPSPFLFRCSHSLRNCETLYLEDAARLGIDLNEFEKDFGVFDFDHLFQTLKLKTRSECRFKFLDDHRHLNIPLSSWSFSSSSSGEYGGQAQVDTPVASDNANQKSTRSRRRGGTKKLKRAHRGTGGGQPKGAHRDLRLLKRAFAKGDFCLSDSFCLRKDGSRTSTGWHGVNPPKLARETIRQLFSTGQIKQHLTHFFPVTYTSGAPALLIDVEDRLFAYRTTPAVWLEKASDEFMDAVLTLVRPHLAKEACRDKCKEGERGDHFPCIIGFARQYSGTPDITAWHKENFEAVNVFLGHSIVQRVIKWASKLVDLFFPGVAARFRESAMWHQEQYGITPEFGLFFNLCINGIFPGEPRIFCSPHADSKNVVGVCALLIYQLQGTKFNHTQRCWIVLWEAGVIIELPPWVMFFYPSSLLYHFNIDVHDIEFVTTDGARPTRANCKPIQDDDELGRGSLVLFNQASMYQGSETGYGSLGAARADGLSGNTNFGNDVEAAFSKFCKMIPLKKLANNKHKTKRE